MNLKFLATLLVLFPGIAFGAARTDSARVGVQRVSAAGARMPNASKTVKATTVSAAQDVADEEEYVDEEEEYVEEVAEIEEVEEKPVKTTKKTQEASANCRDAYRACMDEFCLLDESEGYRCACSSNIEASKSLIQEIQKIQEEADKLYTEGVERENLGAKARLVFGESEAAKKSSRASGLSFSDWLKSGSDDEEDGLGTDYDIGDYLYAMAAEYCESELEACGAKAEMEEMLYSRQVVADCKSFNLPI